MKVYVYKDSTGDLHLFLEPVESNMEFVGYSFLTFYSEEGRELPMGVTQENNEH